MSIYQDAIDGLKFSIDFYHKNPDVILNCEESKFKILQELIDKQEKYKWHDLRKDPNDKNTDICLCVIYREPHTYNIEVLLPNCMSLSSTGKLIAWRRAEEFKYE